jgi:hypothetical protein
VADDDDDGFDQPADPFPDDLDVLGMRDDGPQYDYAMKGMGKLIHRKEWHLSVVVKGTSTALDCD